MELRKELLQTSKYDLWRLHKTLFDMIRDNGFEPDTSLKDLTQDVFAKQIRAMQHDYIHECVGAATHVNTKRAKPATAVTKESSVDDSKSKSTKAKQPTRQRRARRRRVGYCRDTSEEEDDGEEEDSMSDYSQGVSGSDDDETNEGRGHHDDEDENGSDGSTSSSDTDDADGPSATNTNATSSASALVSVSQSGRAVSQTAAAGKKRSTSVSVSAMSTSAAGSKKRPEDHSTMSTLEKRLIFFAVARSAQAEKPRGSSSSGSSRVLSSDKEQKERLVVVFARGKKTGIKSVHELKWFLDHACGADVRHVILVSNKGLTHPANVELQIHVAPTHRVRTFVHADLLANAMQHEDVRPHRKMSKDENKALVAKYKLGGNTPFRLATLCAHDPVVIYNNLEEHDTVEIKSQAQPAMFRQVESVSTL